MGKHSLAPGSGPGARECFHLSRSLRNDSRLFHLMTLEMDHFVLPIDEPSVMGNLQFDPTYLCFISVMVYGRVLCHFIALLKNMNYYEQRWLIYLL